MIIVILWIGAILTMLYFAKKRLIPYIRRQRAVRKGRKVLKNVIKRVDNPEDKERLEALSETFTDFLKQDKI